MAMVAGSNKPLKPRRGKRDWMSILIVVYVLAGVTTAAYYTRKEETEDTVIEGIIYGAIWPLHWLLELIEYVVE